MSHSSPEGNITTPCLWRLNFCYLLCPSIHLPGFPVNTKLRELTVAPLTKPSPKWTISSPFLSSWVWPWTFHLSSPHPKCCWEECWVWQTLLAHHQQKLPGLCLGLCLGFLPEQLDKQMPQELHETVLTEFIKWQNSSQLTTVHIAIKNACYYSKGPLSSINNNKVIFM